AGWAAINTVVSFYYYVRFIRAMYLSGERAADPRPLSLSPALRVALVVCVVAVVVTGVYPQPFIKIAETLVASLAGGGVIALR
ncbi:MAG TPA: hypothetical protein VF754_06740, partial [Pyrinomonadaceae bacterium]